MSFNVRKNVKSTSEFEAAKTNEFLRRRKLRLQQVREQSKDIAKHIRQRAKTEKLKHLVELDSKKEKNYLQKQKEVVAKLETIYSKGIENVGTGHKTASEVSLQQEVTEKLDPSELRGKVAATVLRHKKQQQLDQQKKLLDRKLQAREAANEISRQKSATFAIQLPSKPATEPTSVPFIASTVKNDKLVSNPNETDKIINSDSIIDINLELNKTDMATQWEENVPSEWVPTIPKLPLSKDDKDSIKTGTDNLSQNSKKIDLFALSAEMPSSLRGSQVFASDIRVKSKPSLTLVSEYLHQRSMGLRDPHITVTKKKVTEDTNNLRLSDPVTVTNNRVIDEKRKLRLSEAVATGPKQSSDELKSIKQTILRTRASRTEGIVHNSCHVHDDQVIPVPSWRPETSWKPCSSTDNRPRQYYADIKPFTTITSLPIDSTLPFKRPVSVNHDSCFGNVLPPSPIIRGSSPFHRSKVCPRAACISAALPKEVHTDKHSKGNGESLLARKNSVTVYNHLTRDSRSVAHSNEKIVVRDLEEQEDAYSQAMKERSTQNSKDRDHDKRLQDMRSKIAMTKQNVEKEYKDTMSFLNSMPKEKPSKGVKMAFMDEPRQQAVKDVQQKKLQHQFKKIERECRKHPAENVNYNKRAKSTSPSNTNIEDDVRKDFQYSWMPVPESDANLAIHTIPTSLKEPKSGNTVTFNTVDNYHEYRSRHKHTPPTKDTNEKQTTKSSSRKVETVIIEHSNSYENTESSSESLISSNDSHKYRTHLQNSDRKTCKRREKHGDIDLSDVDKDMSDAERIIIYKILDSRKEKDKAKKRLKFANVKSMNIEKQIRKCLKEKFDKPQASVEQIKEGVYKTVNTQGENISSLNFEDNRETSNKRDIGDTITTNEQLIKKKDSAGASHPQENGDSTNSYRQLPTTSKNKEEIKADVIPNTPPPSAATSAASFKTAQNDKTNDISYVKLVDNDGQEAGKVFIDPNGILKDDAYEVVIQLRKKAHTKRVGGAQEINNEHKETATNDVAVANVKSTENKVLDKSIYKATQSQSNIVNNNTEGVSDYILGEVKKQLADGNLKYDDNVDYSSKSEPNRVVKSSASAYTQTSYSSPVHQRPVYFHMSSSTSTAYMSPPEMVLPEFLKSDSAMPCENTFEQKNKVPGYETENNKKYKKCKCKKCKRKLNICLIERTERETSDHNKYKGSLPPNATNSTKQANTDEVSQKKCECNQCTGDTKSQFPRQYYVHKHKINGNKSKHVIINEKSQKRSVHSKLNPVVKKYVNKLLALNKEGLKAIEIANQECSSVTTPESSIVNIPCNLHGSHNDAIIENKISLEQIKNILKQQVVDDFIKEQHKNECCSVKHSESLDALNIEKPCAFKQRINKKRPPHKVKSLNISKHINHNTSFNKPRKQRITNEATTGPQSSSSSTKENVYKTPSNNGLKKTIQHSPSSPPHGQDDHFKFTNKTSLFGTKDDGNSNFHEKIKDADKCAVSKKHRLKHQVVKVSSSRNSNSSNTNLESTSNDIPLNSVLNFNKNRVSSRISRNSDDTNHISTQTSQEIDSDISVMKKAEDKLQNMEKIADLTEKCTQRLSNLAKVLEEVRKNKSLAYSQISSTDSDNDLKPVKSIESLSSIENHMQYDKGKNTETTKMLDMKNSTESHGYEPLLKGIPKPSLAQISPQPFKQLPEKINVPETSKSKTRPPPALTRIHLRNGDDDIKPHELSTVMEVDSPMSLKFKSHTQQIEDSTEKPVELNNESEMYAVSSSMDIKYENPDLVQTNVKKAKTRPKSTKNKLLITGQDSQTEMMDLKKFNEIMLKPFISIEDYAKQCKAAVVIEDGSNIEDHQKFEMLTDDLSSLHSDGSLPDVISELLKRKIISEPFKFDTASNINSTTISSESSQSVFALSKAVQNKKQRSSIIFQNKENIAESSDISSNPDLEKAFKQLGLGWASSTLKKTKERLALSSSSNTSSSSISKKNIKNYNDPMTNSFLTDFVTNKLELSRKKLKNTENSNTVQQQTSFSKSMTVREFLAKELADKITFNKSRDNESQEFVSLCETKMPEEMKQLSHMIREERSIDSTTNPNRARTSTPVQLYKNATYHSSSSSNNISNGLFGNVDDLSSVKATSSSMRNHSTSEKDDLTIPNCSLKIRKNLSERSKSD